MNDEQWKRLRALFDSAQGMSEGERGPFLDRELRDEPELRAELDTLLAHAASASSFLVTQGGGETGTPGASPAAGSSIGPYRILEVLGEGGFGVVYLAEQTRPIRRRVALKLIKPGMDTKQVIARFEAERQALALMDHPGIAQVFDAGETDAGRPYFAMEFVPGAPITAFCDQERLPILERLDLFLKVCDAVHHAHQKGVIHRDIKPSNVLVARRDGVAALKVIDFGIVKATSAAIDDQTLLTREGMILGTLGYMSPEQIGAIESPVDTRSDIYSLGVLLYELLAGDLPFDRARLRKAAWTEAVRIIREEDPPSLTSRLARIRHVAEPTSSRQGGAGDESSGADRLTEIARQRSVDERALMRELKGELEWITQRALEKDPDRRYASASELAADVRRHLTNQTVLARAPSTMYRVRKFARRHRVGVAAAALVLLSIVGGSVAAGIGFARAVRAERAARREADSARRVADFLVDLFQTADPNRSRGETITARTLLDQGTRRMKASIDQDPQIRARLLTTLGNAHLSLGLYDEGLLLLREALATSEAARPPNENEIAGHLRELARGMLAAGKTDRVDSLLEQSIEATRRLKGSGSASLAAALALKAEWLGGRGELGPADSVLRLAIPMAESQPGPDTLQLIRMYSTRAKVNHRRFALSDAENDYLKALDFCAKSGGQPTTAVVLRRQIANLYSALRDPVKALHHAEVGVRLARQLYAPEHPGIALALSGQASALTSEGEYAQAAAVREEAVRILRAGEGRHDILCDELNSLGILYRATLQFDLAIARAEESCALARALYGPRSARTADMTSNLARYCADAGQLVRADSIYRQTLPLFDRLDTIHAAYAFMGYANLCRDLGRFAAADSHYALAEAAMDTSQAGFRLYVAECSKDHGYLRSLQGRHAEAESLMRYAFGLASREYEETDAALAEFFVSWAAARARAGNADGAIEALEKAARCGVTRQDVSKYRELASLTSRQDYPDGLRK